MFGEIQSDTLGSRKQAKAPIQMTTDFQPRSLGLLISTGEIDRRSLHFKNLGSQRNMLLRAESKLKSHYSMDKPNLQVLTPTPL